MAFPDEQARAEVEAHLNRLVATPNPDLMSEYESLYGIAVGQVLELRAIAVFLPPRLPHESLAQVADMVVRQRDEWERTARQSKGWL